ncbi:MAG: hypothetical protein AMXMBFR33_62990 [Candidatus Xenobia bacterium]|jgi:hypothetical protein
MLNSRLLSLLIVLLATAVGWSQSEWQSFTAPDGTFSLSVPGQPEQTRSDSELNEWTVRSEGTRGKRLYLFAAARLDGLSGMSDSEQDQQLSNFTRSFVSSSHMQVGSQVPLTFSKGYDLTGYLQLPDGEDLPAYVRIIMDPLGNRIYALTAYGSNTDHRRYFESFQTD